ncbi:hypothetical protein BY996DRAFT_6420872 [Phakopsora pachyrhizi]|nr:hypothetical protein BY996DRAFT_6420872 [Phakopsora pachyrhizi]
MNGLSIFQIKVHNKYSADDFDNDLQTVLLRAECKAEKICFIIDESNALDSGFLEQMNTLLVNAQAPDLFEDWLGDWSNKAFYQVGMEFNSSLGLDSSHYTPPANFPAVYGHLSCPPVHQAAIINALVAVQKSMYETNCRLACYQGQFKYATPQHYLDFINNYVALFFEKRDDLEEQQSNLNIGLDKLRDTVIQVKELQKTLAIKSAQLEKRSKEADTKLAQTVSEQEEQKKDIAEQKQVVMGDLADAKPAVEEAQAAASLKYKSELPLAKFLSTADDQLGWQSKLLPPDDLCTENTIMLKRFNHYPLVLDPSGQATIFLMNEYKDQKMLVTSFLDEAFVKSLESSLNFGTPLLIQDVEHLDPILNAVLNKELC